MQKGIEIDFFDLLRNLWKKWPVLLVVALVFGLFANLYGWKQISAAEERERRALEEYASQLEKQNEGLSEYMTAELAELRSALTEQEASFVEAVAKLYMYRMWASEKINAELIVGEPDEGDLEIVQTLYYANEGVESGTNVMTSAEKSYYNVLVKGLSKTDMSAVTNDISVPGFLQPKWLAIGCVLGLFFGSVVLALLYMLSGKLRLAADMEDPFGVPVLATLREGESGDADGLAKGLERLLGDRKTLAICCVDTLEAASVYKNITVALEKRDVRTIMTDDDNYIGRIAEADAVLFVEQVGKSRYSDIERHVSCCRKFSIPAAGCIVVV